MDVVITILKQKKIKVILVFFCFITILSCSKNSSIELTKIYNNTDKVIGIQFNNTLNSDAYKIVLKGHNTSVLGTFTEKKGRLTFNPVIPFTSGESYEIRKDSIVMTEFTIPVLENHISPTVEHIYPTSSILPENLLKMYFVFSEPMQEVGNILDYITIINKTKDLEEEVFLNLESELWNKEHTILTLWLDPGRIKTDLIPNKEKGLPILDGNRYALTISKELKSAKGIPIATDYIKNFKVTKRDKQKPSLTDWKLTVPAKNTTTALSISLDEALDAILLKETILMYYKDKKIEGDFSLSDNETLIHFKPKDQWQSGQYQIIVSSILEDLAGNNLNRLFDSDVDAKVDDVAEETLHKSLSFFVE